MAWLMSPGQGEPLTFLEELIRRPSWQRHGACRGESIETFVPSLGGKFDRAREVCRGCTVRQQCLDFALADEDVVGMWGGTTAAERRAMRAERGAA
jgi:WhiB family transcriptional regulator, redox-sensing transcriptional regulator